jgi:putative sterol carrier protein
LTAYESRASLEAVLNRLAEFLRTDRAFLEGSQGKMLTVSFEFPDLETFFYTSLRNGQVEAGLGQSAESPTVELVMDSEIFDQIFSGQMNPAKAAVKGDLAFSGNMAEAIRFQGLMPNFIRLYQKALNQQP